ncbi:type VI secretion system-associated protein TagF, partial [Roseomonas eburnea]
MPDALPLTGLYGKVPAHGDFVRRGLPTSFVGPWDAWLQAGIARAREGMGEHWPAAWDAAPAWRFALPAGACGPDAVAGVMLPSEDQVGRRFPITLAVLLPPGEAPPASAWFDVVEAAAWAGRSGHADADALAAALPLPGAPLPDVSLPIAAPVGPPASVAAAPDPSAFLPAVTLGELSPEPPLDSPGASDDVLALLAGGGAQAAPEPEDRPSDVLALLGGGAPDMPFATETPPAEAPTLPGGVTAPDTDGTLAMLIGAADGDAPPAADPPGEGDPLAALIGAGADADAAPAEDMLPAAAAALPWPDAAGAAPGEDAG